MAEHFLRGALVDAVHHAEGLERLAEAVEMQDAAGRVLARDAGGCHVPEQGLAVRHGDEHGRIGPLSFDVAAQFGRKAGMQRHRPLVAILHRFRPEKSVGLVAVEVQVGDDEGADLGATLAGVGESLIHQPARRRGGEEGGQLGHGEGTGNADLFATHRHGADLGQRVDCEAVQTDQPVEQRVKGGLILSQGLGGHDLPGAPAHELVRADVGQTLPAGLLEDDVDAVPGVADVLRRDAPGLHVGQHFTQQGGEGRGGGLALRARGEDAGGLALGLHDDLAELGASRGLVGRAEGHGARFLAPVEGVAAGVEAAFDAVARGAENVFGHRLF